MLAPARISPRGGFIAFATRALALVSFVLACSFAFPPAAAADPEPTPAETRQHPYPNMVKVLSDKTQKEGRNANAKLEEIERWVKDLDADVYKTRRRAATELRAVGKRIVPAISKQMQNNDSLELRIRGLEILVEMAVSENVEDESAAYEALNGLKTSSDQRLASRSADALESIESTYNGRAIRRLQAKGAIADMRFVYQPGIRQFPPQQQPPSAAPRYNYLLFNEKWHGTPADLEMLRFVNGIQWVVLDGDKITDEFAAAIANCKSLQTLTIRRTKITDAGIAKLTGLNQLGGIDILFTKISDESIASIGSLKSAKYVNLFGTKISSTKLPELEKMLPGCRITIRGGGFLGVGPKVDMQRVPIVGQGCVINRPEPGSAAEKAGLNEDDVILKYGDKKIASFDELRAMTGENGPGDEIIFTIRRGETEKEMKIILGEWPSNLMDRR